MADNKIIRALRFITLFCLSASFLIGTAFFIVHMINESKRYSYKDMLETKAAEGDGNAMQRLGNNHRFGRGVFHKDLKLATQWYEKAVAAGDSDSMIHLAIMYEDGEFFEKNLKKAFELFEQAAALENKYGKFNLGRMYYSGIYVEKDRQKARNLFEQGAALGNTASKYFLSYYLVQEADALSDETIQAKMYLQAGEYLQEAVQKKLSGAEERLNFFVKKCNKDTQYYKPSLTNISSCLNAFGSDDTVAQHVIGLVFYKNSFNVSQPPERAFKHMQRAAMGGNPYSQMMLASLYSKGIGVEKNPIEAFAWHDTATNQFIRDSQFSPDFKATGFAIIERLKYHRALETDEDRHLATTRAAYYLKEFSLPISGE